MLVMTSLAVMIVNDATIKMNKSKDMCAVLAHVVDSPGFKVQNLHSSVPNYVCMYRRDGKRSK